MQNEIEKFLKVKEAAEIQYRKIDKIYCPFLKKNVNFNAKGLDHIKFKAWNKARLISDQYLRLKFLRLASDILAKSGTLQEYNDSKNFERVKSNSQWRQLMMPVKYYGFVAVLNYDIRVKVVVKEICGGQPYFWSIIPFWKNYKHPITDAIKKVFHDGDLEFD
ncbi:MAG: hypothetical protein V1867_02575 [Candidatus Falkowbacteria bacterium]